MDVLEELHVLADYEEVELALVHDFKLLHDFACAGMAEAEEQLYFLVRFYGGGLGVEVEVVIANIEGGGVDQVHAAARTLAGDVHCVIGVHGADPGGVFLVRAISRGEESRREKR